MLEPRTTRICVWKALLDGDCKQIAKSEAQLRHELKNQNAWYKSTNKSRWTYISADEDVPVVKGILRDWSAEGGCGRVHVHYICPHCESEEYCVDDPDDRSPYLWFCENGKGLILIEVA